MADRVLHARLVAQDGAAETVLDGSMVSTATRWPWPIRYRPSLDEGGLAHARHAADAQAERARVGQQRREQLIAGLCAVSIRSM